MAISFKAPSNIIKFKVKGSVKDGTGVDQAFAFELEATRINQDDAQAIINSGEKTVDIMADLVTGWTGVKDGTSTIEYSTDNFRALCREYPGLSNLVFSTYFGEVGAKAKN